MFVCVCLLVYIQEAGGGLAGDGDEAEDDAEMGGMRGRPDMRSGIAGERIKGGGPTRPLEEANGAKGGRAVHRLKLLTPEEPAALGWEVRRPGRRR